MSKNILALTYNSYSNVPNLSLIVVKARGGGGYSPKIPIRVCAAVESWDQVMLSRDFTL